MTGCPTRNMEKLTAFSSLKLYLFLLLIISSSSAFSIEHPILSIQASANIVVGEELTITVEVMDSSGQLANDSRNLSLIIFNTDTSETKSIRLINGKAEEKVTLEKAGASLIEVIDPHDSTFVQYKPFDVIDRPRVKK